MHKLCSEPLYGKLWNMGTGNLSWLFLCSVFMVPSSREMPSHPPFRTGSKFFKERCVEVFSPWATFCPQTIKCTLFGSVFLFFAPVYLSRIYPRYKDPKTNGFNLFKLKWVWHVRWSNTLYLCFIVWHCNVMPWSSKNFSDGICLTDMEIMLISIRSVPLMINFKCLFSWKNLLFKYVQTVFYVYSCSLFYLCYILVNLYFLGLYFPFLLILSPCI